MRYHLEGLPPVCLLHGIDDPDGLAIRTGELSPTSQSVQLADELERRDHPHDFYAYEGLKHYFSTSADNATTQSSKLSIYRVGILRMPSK